MIQDRFVDKVVLITGGSSGIGFVTAQKLVAEGAGVIITGRDPNALEAAREKLGGRARIVQSDVSRVSDLDHLYSTIRREYGRLDGLFANAGVAKFTPIAEVTPELYDSLFDINVKGLYFTLQKAAPLLAKGSSVVLNASVVASRGPMNASLYAASKAAVRSFGRTFAAEWQDRGVRVNVVSPGPIETPIWAEAAAPMKQQIAEKNPMKRYGTPEEVAAAVTFLLSDDASYMLGTEIFVDGGANQL